jgi:poly(ADP-ribose) glycohydrolase ARH3
MIDESKFKGCFLGLAIGDAFGAPFEGGLIERFVWFIIGKTRKGKKRFTDDTQMSIDVAQSFLKRKTIDQEHLAQTFAMSYRWSRGYGPAAANLLKGIKKGDHWQDLNRKKYKDGSLGNGAAMRAPIVTLCHPVSDEILKDNIKKTSEITHAHPLAIEGAQLIAITTCMALEDCSNNEILQALQSESTLDIYLSKLEKCTEYCHLINDINLKNIKRVLGNKITASESGITAIYFALKYREDDLMNMLSQIFKLGGDTDTIGAMAGSIWGAFNGDKDILHLAKDVENNELINTLSNRLYKEYLSE